MGTMKSAWRRRAFLPLLIAALSFGSTASAFNDIEGHPAQASIETLARSGVVQGVGQDRFVPDSRVSAAQAVQLLVQGFKLNIDHIRFIKEPKAGDYFDNVPDDAWYAQSFIIAHLNGVPIPKDVEPTAAVTREMFAHWLMHAVYRSGDFPFIEIFMLISDGDEIDGSYMDSVQKLLIAKIASLEEDQTFRPKQELTRGQAAVWLDGALRFVESRLSAPAQPQTEEPQRDDVSMQVEKVNEQVNKVTLSWGTKPNSGYRIEVRSLAFGENGEAVVHYELTVPQPGDAYATVITEPKAVVYIPSQYTPVPSPPAGATDAGQGVSGFPGQ